mmetsp:Transcript_8896/g.13266  ORF Transcript_8896/g.13266 Transcript_8896/m.13266 type:complete len:313 (-) Transcript_8896:527-1465(-)
MHRLACCSSSEGVATAGAGGVAGLCTAVQPSLSSPSLGLGGGSEEACEERARKARRCVAGPRMSPSTSSSTPTGTAARCRSCTAPSSACTHSARTAGRGSLVPSASRRRMGSQQLSHSTGVSPSSPEPCSPSGSSSISRSVASSSLISTSRRECRWLSRCTAPWLTEVGAAWLASSGRTARMQKTGTLASRRGSCSSQAMTSKALTAAKPSSQAPHTATTPKMVCQSSKGRRGSSSTFRVSSAHMPADTWLLSARSGPRWVRPSPGPAGSSVSPAPGANSWPSSCRMLAVRCSRDSMRVASFSSPTTLRSVQ